MNFKRFLLLLVTFFFTSDLFNHTGYAQVLKETTSTISTVYVAGSEVLAKCGSTVKYYLHDGQGSVRNLSTNSGVVFHRYYYDAYGQRVSRSNTPVTNILYVGQPWDSDLQFYNNWHRWYNPANGQFNAIDTFSGSNSDPISLHKYLYCSANPINFVDPLYCSPLRNSRNYGNIS